MAGSGKRGDAGVQRFRASPDLLHRFRLGTHLVAKLRGAVVGVDVVGVVLAEGKDETDVLVRGRIEGRGAGRRGFRGQVFDHGACSSSATRGEQGRERYGDCGSSHCGRLSPAPSTRWMMLTVTG